MLWLEEAGAITPEQYDSIDWSGVKSMKLEMIKVMADIAINDNSEYLSLFKS